MLLSSEREIENFNCTFWEDYSLSISISKYLAVQIVPISEYFSFIYSLNYHSEGTEIIQTFQKGRKGVYSIYLQILIYSSSATYRKGRSFPSNIFQNWQNL